MSGSINIPCSNSLALLRLRVDPDKAIEADYYVVQPEGSICNSDGGPCKVECSTRADDPRIHTLNVTSSQGDDFFYPYVQEGVGGVGHCEVPSSARPGTLVLTGAVNGCAIQVNLDGSNLHFYHDANGKCLAKRGAPPGRCVARVEYKTYAGPGDLLNNRTSDLGFPANVTYLITVRHIDGWGIYSSTFLYNKITVTSWLGLGAARTEEVFRPILASSARRIISFLKTED